MPTSNIGPHNVHTNLLTAASLAALTAMGTTGVKDLEQLPSNQEEQVLKLHSQSQILSSSKTTAANPAASKTRPKSSAKRQRAILRPREAVAKQPTIKKSSTNENIQKTRPSSKLRTPNIHSSVSMPLHSQSQCHNVSQG